MIQVLAFLALVIVGGGAGIVARRVSSARPRAKSRLGLQTGSLVFALGDAPGILLAVAVWHWTAPFTAGNQLATLLAAAVVAYVAAYAATAYRHRDEGSQRETALPYELWYGLRQQKPEAADRVLEALWDQLLAERAGVERRVSGARGAESDLSLLVERQAAEMAGAIEVLRRAHAGDPALPPALAVLEERVRRLCNDLAALRPGGGSG